MCLTVKHTQTLKRVQTHVHTKTEAHTHTLSVFLALIPEMFPRLDFIINFLLNTLLGNSSSLCIYRVFKIFSPEALACHEWSDISRRLYIMYCVDKGSHAGEHHHKAHHWGVAAVEHPVPERCTARSVSPSCRNCSVLHLPLRPCLRQCADLVETLVRRGGGGRFLRFITKNYKDLGNSKDTVLGSSCSNLCVISKEFPDGLSP